MSNDASLIAQYVVGLTTLSPAAVEAGKVGGLATLSSFDAGLIAQWVVCIPNAMNQSGRWKFDPTNAAHGSGVIGSNLTENYAATMMGDVNGDWVPSNGARPAFKEDPNGVRGSVSDRTAQAGSIVTVPFSIGNLPVKGMTSYQFDVEYDPAVLRPVENSADISGTQSGGLTAFSNAPEPGLLKVVAFGALPVTGDGVYAKLRFAVIGTAGSSSVLSIRNFRFDDGNMGTTTTAGLVSVTASDHQGSFNGRVLSADGRGLGRMDVVLTSPVGETFHTVTNSFGYFSFEGLTPGATYTLRVDSKRYHFEPITVSITDTMSEVDLIAR
jgi:hypothetical protein